MTGNIYIKGDNLEVLKLLQCENTEAVKMIYIDPPYNTGNDYVYEDKFGSHTKWLDMMSPRLELAVPLLRDDGVIFISIDDREVHHLRLLCDKIFGFKNFVAQFIWQRAFAPKNDAKFVSVDHEYIICYAKDINKFKIGLLPRTDKANNRYKNPDNDPRGPWVADNLTAKRVTERDIYEITTPSGRVVLPAHGSSWRVSRHRFEGLLADNRIWFGKNGSNVPRIKRFLCEVQRGMRASSIMLYQDVGHSQEGRQELKKLFDGKGIFDAPKPVRLIKRLLLLANTKEDDIILDFFSGSATTAHAVMELNAEDGGARRFIMVQKPVPCAEKSEARKAGYKDICEIGLERIRRAGGNKAKLMVYTVGDDNTHTYSKGEHHKSACT